MPTEKSIDYNDPEILHLIKTVKPFSDLDKHQLESVLRILKHMAYNAGDVVLREGDMGSSAYIVASGQFRLEIMGQAIRDFLPGDFFGEIALIDKRPRMGTVTALSAASLLSLDGTDLEQNIEPEITMKIYRGFSRLITSYMREGSNLYNSIDVLLVQDGGCAPGYNPVTAFLSEYLEKMGRKVFVCAEGFRSLISNKPQDYRRLVYNTHEYHRLEHFPGVIFSPPLRESRGADFRSERFSDFRNSNLQKVAAESLAMRNVQVVIAIGGNGTFAGIKALSKLLPKNILTYFVPVTIDSDIFGTECIGEYTGVEIGSEKIRCYMADSRTHKRIYIIEVMGAHGGYHALHSSLGAGAHLAVLPGAEYDLKAIAQALSKRENAVIVVAEGYKSDKRKATKFNGNAAEFFREELETAGLNSKCRVICEPFSRDIRGAQPNNLDLMLAQRMARKISELILKNRTQEMPSVLSGHESSIQFQNIRTDNSVKSELASLANRLTAHLSG